MSKKRPNKQTCVNAITELLEKGTSHRDCLAILSKNWHYPKRTFSNHYYEALELHNKRREAIEKKKLEQTTALELKAEKTHILSRFDLLERLSKIIKCEVVDANNKTPTFNDQIRAIEKYSQMQGYDAPKELKVEGVLPIINLSD